MSKQGFIMGRIADERVRQNIRWGDQVHSWPVWMNILMEEVGEASISCLAAEFKDNDEDQELVRESFERELIQVAAVAVAILESLQK